MQNLVWTFDLGKGSLGEAVRRDNAIVLANSWLIPEDLAQRGPAKTAGTPASRHRAWRTRWAHKSREERLNEIFRGADIEVLEAGDPRLGREFPAKGDETCYASCLLRAKLLRGESLQGWQVYKAVRSAIQRRGYDPNPAWTGRSSSGGEAESGGNAKDKEEAAEMAKRLCAYNEALEKMAAGRTQFQFPCFLEAWRLGLWSPDKPDAFALRIDHNASPARNRERPETLAIVPPRELVEAEVKALLEAAGRLFPKLAGKADEIIHGPGARRYASFFPELRKAHGLKQGGPNDRLGILGQLIPRFDNRIIAKCSLIPRFNVCKAQIRKGAQGMPHPDSLLVAEVTFLMKLKNMRVVRLDKTVTGLTAAEIRSVFEDPKRTATKFSLTATQWRKVCSGFGAHPAPGHLEVTAPSEGGRSRFCRPALRILKALILSGEAPTVAHERELKALNGNTDPKKGLVPADLKFLRRMGDTWDTLYVPDQKFDALLALRAEQGRDAAISALIGDVKDPIVRHRLNALKGRLVELERTYGEPSEVVLEFVRDDFMGEKAKKALQKFQNERAEARKKARSQLTAMGGEQARRNALKLELLMAQGFQCLYTGENLPQTELDSLEIEHIVPRALGGARCDGELRRHQACNQYSQGRSHPVRLVCVKRLCGMGRLPGARQETRHPAAEQEGEATNVAGRPGPS